MKKNIFISLCMVMAVTAVLTSCKKDNDVVSLRATISDYRDTGKDGKTYIETINNVDWVSWNNNDKVLINGTQHTVTVSGSGNGRYATIEGVTYVTPNENNPSVGYYAFYPAERALTTPTSGFPQIMLPQVQIYRTDGANKNTGNQIVEAPMAAFCKANSTQVGLNFTNLCALLKIDLSSLNLATTTEVAYITVSSTSTPLWGKATISGTDSPILSTPSRTGLSTNDNTVTLDFTDNGIAGSDGNPDNISTGSAPAHGVTSRGPFYVVLPPATDVTKLAINIYVFTGSNNNHSTVRLYTRTDVNGHTIDINAGNIYNPGGLGDYTVNDDVTPSYPNLGTGIFSVSNSKKVRFSLGNLQYLGSTQTWRFAEHQYDVIGNTDSKKNPSQDQEAWMDLFNWGTSGHNNIVPWSTTNYASEKASSDYPLTKGDFSGSQYDWGKNPIINGGNQPNKWRTLTGTEWHYLIFRRDRASYLAKRGKYNNVKGLFILPDSRTLDISDYISSPTSNISNATWNNLMNLGCIFLPAGGYRSGSSVYESPSANSSSCNYWASSDFLYGISLFSVHEGNCLYYSNSVNYYYRNFNCGLSVRLVRDVD